MKGRKVFFFEKKQRETFVTWRTRPMSTCATEQKCFGSFFQKRTAFFFLFSFFSFAAVAQPQPKLPTAPLTISGHGGPPHHFTVELATTPAEQETGEMFRTSIPPDQGMFFDWGTPREVPMWMKNCPVPEDMVFIGADGTIAHIAENTVPESLAEISSGGPVRATLELQGGLTAKLDIRVGDKVQGVIFK
jgi:uncharacterized membrane protein (UPF0127 family)